jgi:hypothetical protein
MRGKFYIFINSKKMPRTSTLLCLSQNPDFQKSNDFYNKNALVKSYFCDSEE